MKRFLVAMLCCAYFASAWAQSITLPPSGDNQKSSVTQWIGLASITITYFSPDVHTTDGEDRTGHIWGELVPYGFTNPGYGTSSAAPWRAGANENTTVHFSHDVVIQGKSLQAGTYGLFVDVQKEGPWTWIFSTESNNWGHYHYDPSKDALRITATPTEAPYTEWLTYGFDEREKNSAVAYLQWEKKRIAFKVEVPNVNEMYVEKIRGDIKGHRMGFNNQSWMDAAQFCASNKINLEEALTWADYAINGRYIGVEDFNSLQTKAMVLQAMERDAEADNIMQKAIALPSATVTAIHQYGRSLLAAGKTDKALEVFKLNRKKNPQDKFTTYVGLARGYAATGDKKNAIKNWETALKNLPEEHKPNRPFYESELKKLKG
ncbi:MAG TPA: DUF2911 domain-containing protein [Ohtaekwangia sp.]|nr:DUF2911 domain-containing protein [Ohtaekwangia sp.]